MADQPATPVEPDLYARFRSKTSKEARANLPALIDEVMDSGKPLLIKKLKVGRVALIPARELWIHEIIDRLGMDRASVNQPIEDLMKEVYKRIKNYLEAQPESDKDTQEDDAAQGGEKPRQRGEKIHGGERRDAG